jgi:hypothetical protein
VARSVAWRCSGRFTGFPPAPCTTRSACHASPAGCSPSGVARPSMLRAFFWRR